MKKVMKKVLFLAMIASMLMLAACGGSEKAKESQASGESKTEASASGEKSETAEKKGDLPQGTALKDKVLDVATNVNFPPYEYYEGQKIVGIDADIAEAIGKELGYEVKFHDMDFTNLIASLETGKADVAIAGLTVTPEREKNALFSTPYAKSIQSVIVKEDSPIKSIDDLKGKKIGTQLGTTGDTYAKDDFGAENVQSFNSPAEAVLALQNGKVDCVIIDNEPAKNFVAANKGLKVLDTKYADEDFAIAVGKNNPKLLEEINAALKVLKDSGELDKIIEKYIPSK